MRGVRTVCALAVIGVGLVVGLIVEAARALCCRGE
ncbi:hypothetical protein UFOVP73_49 [uncultured Caudovirales phage]|uniref:Uncharacterized protein n=1 Tax=uncultured Caudovirales phage TaxID=2100421 RepID=A0A6J5KUQ9_9CAUD|nr:hypothetical protein UFOVP73_49 [uncultured Caudovirales phage]CAB5194582.1 hypothetical protein UFOVP170_9 [uncultured Caudovirales phage]